MAVDYVYLAKYRDGLYKVGFSASPFRRVQELRAIEGLHPHIVGTWMRLDGDAKQVEYATHALLQDKRYTPVTTEEFSVSREEAIEAIQEAIRIIDAELEEA